LGAHPPIVAALTNPIEFQRTITHFGPEVGQKKPTDTALKLLQLVKAHGLKIIA
jgi:hypothetical protein